MGPVTAQPTADLRFPTDRLLTWDDLQIVPDDRHWAYELVEGRLLVSPTPSLLHQRVVLELAVLLRAACPRGLEVVVSPFDFVPTEVWALQPDVLVVDSAAAERNRTVVPPLLAVEVLSPSSRVTDRTLKRAAYEEHGVASYWIVDPDAPSVQVLEAEGGRYGDRGTTSRDDALEVTRPFPVRVVPSALVRR